MRRVLALAGVVAAASSARRVSRFTADAPVVEPADLGDVDGDAAAERLAQLVRIPTISRDAAEVDAAAFARFRERLAELYPRTFAALELEVLGAGALLLRWRSGSDAPPLVLMAHYDVVPVEGQDWHDDPFSGRIAEGLVHGRGAIDDKGALVAVLEAVEQLVARGFTPARDVYLSFGDDEEVFGTAAQQAVQALTGRGIRPWAVVDEGGAVVSGIFPGVAGPIAVVGVAEKGMLDLELATEDPGGHASTPTPMGATARLARAVLRLEEPFPARLDDVVLTMVDTLGRQAHGLPRVLFAHAPLLRPALAAVLARSSRQGNALVRTTLAITQLQGSAASNVLATRARATANIRIALGETVQSSVARVRQVVDDPRVALRVLSGSDPSPVSRTDNPPFAQLSRAIRSVYPDATVTPYVMIQASDARHWAQVSDSVYRFMPFDLTAAELATLHAADERLPVAALRRGIGFYRALIEGL